MSRDPLLRHLGIIINRSILFVVISLAQAIALWLWFWTRFENWTIWQVLRYAANAWPLSAEVFPSVMALGVLWIGLADTAIVYLLLGRWWRRRADVLHRRGSRFIDQREEQ